MKYQELIGKKFGMLTYLRCDVNYKAFFQCDCGERKLINRNNVVNGYVQSCGCLRKKRKGCLIGQEFGYFYVEDYVTNKGYKCKCVCGNIKYKATNDLQKGNTKSCGCMQNHVDNLSGKWFQDLYVIRRLTDLSNISHKNKKKAFWICCCKCGKQVILNTAKLKTQKSCGCNNVAHVQSGGSKRYPYLYKRWHHYKKLNQLSEEFAEFSNFLSHVLETVGNKPFPYSYLTKIDDSKPLGSDNIVYKHLQHNVIICDNEHRWCTSCKRYVEFSDKFWNLKKTSSGCKKCVHAGTIKRKYNLDYADYLQMKHNCKNKCEICNGKRPLVIDHCHTTNKVRGLLCSQCNSGLGHIKDNIEYLKKMIVYLDRDLTDIDFKANTTSRKHDPVDNCCPITGNTQTVLDHCHNTNKVRGNIDWSANIALGHFQSDKDIIDNAISYLDYN